MQGRICRLADVVGLRGIFHIEFTIFYVDYLRKKVQKDFDVSCLFVENLIKTFAHTPNDFFTKDGIKMKKSTLLLFVASLLVAPSLWAYGTGQSTFPLMEKQHMV